MKSFIQRFLFWLILDVFLAIIPWILFLALIVGSGPGKESLSIGWLVVCCLLLATMFARVFFSGRLYLFGKTVAAGWRIFAFLLHLVVLAGGIYMTCVLGMILLGAGTSAGEPS